MLKGKTGINVQVSANIERTQVRTNQEGLEFLLGT
jgi:hypothetical protein